MNTPPSPLILLHRMFAEHMVDLQEPNGWDVRVQSCVLCCWKRVFAMTTAFSWQNSISLCPASFCTPRQICLLLQVSLDFLLCTPVPYNEKDISFGC